MSLLGNIKFGRSRDRPKSRRGVPTGRQTTVGNGYFRSLSPYRSRTYDTLKELRLYRDESQALEFLKKVNPDVSMAVWNFVRLANQGHETHFYSIGKKQSRLSQVEDKWTDFASRVNEISNSGLDGLIDQLHYSSFLLGGMGVEAEVTQDRKDIYDLYVIKPQTIHWELGVIDNHKKWIPYQWQMGKKVPLDPSHANFFWVPADPDIGDPRGSLNMASVLQAVDFQLQILQDLQAVLHHQGWPRNDIEIVSDKIMSYCPQKIKNDPEKMAEWYRGECLRIQTMLENLKPDSDYIHSDDTKIQLASGANGGRSLDVRAITELVDVQLLNGSKQMGILTNRVGGIGQTESWGSITYKIFTDGILACQRGSKRLMESIARLWLRVNGIQATPVFTHNVVNWENEEQKTKVKLMKQQFWVISQLMGWCDPDIAAQEVTDQSEAFSDKPSESIKVSLSCSSDTSSVNLNGNHGRGGEHSGNDQY